MATRDLRSYFTSQKNKKKKYQAGISELLMRRLKMLNWRASVRKKEERALHTILGYLFMLRRKWGNMYTGPNTSCN